jgi:selenocysteine lyase/cysteine desulfurase
VDELRAKEYARLDNQDEVYLDYTGGSLYAQSQLDSHYQLLKEAVLGNPHSANPTSSAMTEHVESARRYVLQYFNATDDYICVFTLNASGALKLVGESFPFGPGGWYLATFDNHNSVNGIREFAKAKGAAVDYAPLNFPELRIDLAQLQCKLEKADPEKANLFAFPAQSNFTGVKHPLEIVDLARQNGWKVLLDAAAFVPTNRLDLNVVKPDFVSLSFYKMFGYPTGVGALLIRKSAYPILRRPWFAGGTVNFTSVQARAHMLYKGEAAFEDGTLNYLSIPAVEVGLRHLERIGVDTLGERVRCLSGWLLESLLALKHTNGRPAIRVYGPASTVSRGATLTLNVYDAEGHLLDYRRVEELAGKQGISLRTGCFCNPGAGEIAEGLNEADMLAGYSLKEDINLQSFVKLLQVRGQNKSAGAIRASFGIASNFADAWHFLEFLRSFRDQTQPTIGEVTFDIPSCRVIRDGS